MPFAALQYNSSRLLRLSQVVLVTVTGHNTNGLPLTSVMATTRQISHTFSRSKAFSSANIEWPFQTFLFVPDTSAGNA
jgi:hypothetical protein